MNRDYWAVVVKKNGKFSPVGMTVDGAGTKGYFLMEERDDALELLSYQKNAHTEAKIAKILMKVE